MDLYAELGYWLFVDIFLGSYFILPIGVSAFCMSVIIYSQNNYWFDGLVFFETWRDVAIGFAVLSVISIGIVRFVFARKSDEDPDINEY